MNRICVVGSGGREHALATCFAKSPTVKQVFVIGGSDGMKDVATVVHLSLDDHQGIIDFALRHQIDLVVIGPEGPLSKGLADDLNQANIRVFGPSQAAAQLESSKSFAKAMMKKYNIPTADYAQFDCADQAVAYVKNHSMPLVVKADGLMAGKGVTVAFELSEAICAIEDVFRFNPSGRVVIEEFLEGKECSFMALVHHQQVIPLDLARDYKRAYDGHQGPNTGGMGAFSPVEDVSEVMKEKALETILKPMAKAMVLENIPFTGILYAGLMVHNDQVATVEFNVRFGDPETEVVLPRLLTPLDQLLLALLDHRYIEPMFSDQVCLGVVLAAQGYPKEYLKDQPLPHLGALSPLFHMGTTYDLDKGMYVSKGGRVVFVYQCAKRLEEAKEAVYQRLSAHPQPAVFYRSDIGD